jgi:hypothetical protein
MAEQQKCKKLAAVIVEHQDHFAAMSSDDCQWAIQNPKDAIAIFADAVKNRTAPAEKKLLERLLATVAIPGVTSFTAKEHFVLDTSKKAAVKISYLGDNFKKHFLSKVEKSEVAAEELAINNLLEYAHDPAIITSLGGEAKVEISLGQFFAAFAKQAKGEDGPLLTNGWANVGYIRDINGVLWAVFGLWDVVGWSFEAPPLDNPFRWRDGYRFLAR